MAAGSTYSVPMGASASVSLPRGVRAGAVVSFLVGPLAVAATTLVFVHWHVANATTVALSYLLVVLFVASSAPRWAAIATSVLALLALNYYYLPPLGTLAIAEGQNLVAWVTFIAVSLVASHLASLARRGRDEAVARRDDLARLFDLSRDVLLSADQPEPLANLAASIAGRFRLRHVALHLPGGDGFERHAFGAPAVGCVTRTPIRLGDETTGTLELSGRALAPETADTLASLVAIAVEHAALVAARRQAEVRQRSAELQSALLASLAHDLRTPLTAIRVAVANLSAPGLRAEQRSDQSDIVRVEVGRLERLFHNVIQMARIESGAVTPDLRFVHPLEITEAARSQVDHSLREHTIALLADEGGDLVRVDPRLTSAALAHLLENAAQYSPAGSTITLTHEVSHEGLLIVVQDEGLGVNGEDLPHVFDRFYRGASVSRHSTGTGMGLAITRGLLAAENGRVWIEERAGLGARFCLFVPAERRPISGELDR
jgi:two-component system sensor histidine kinase KdpD